MAHRNDTQTQPASRFARLAEGARARAWSWAMSWVVPVRAAFLMAKAAPRLLRARTVVLLTERSGFGHTIHGPDATRRLFPGGRTVFIALDKAGNFNPSARRIWPDLHVVYIPAAHSLPDATPLPGGEERLRRCAGLVRGLCRLLAPRARMLSLLEAYALMEPEGVRQGLPEHFRPPRSSMAFFVGYPDLLRNRPVEPCRLPDRPARRVEQGIDRALAERGLERPARTCYLYLRHDPAENPTSNRRNGSPLKAWLPALRLLQDKGYLVLLVGDRDLDGDLESMEGVPACLLDARSAGVDRHLFALHAATSADFFIGEVGGGMYLPVINRIPGLLANVFPFSFGMPGCLHLYKEVFDGNGRRLPYETIFHEHGYDYGMAGLDVRCNDEQELLQALALCLDRLASGAPEGSEDVVRAMPPWFIMAHAQGRIDPGWLRRHAPDPDDTWENHSPENHTPEQDMSLRAPLRNNETGQGFG